MSSLRSTIAMALLALSVPCLGLACESEVNVRDPQCAKHPPPKPVGSFSSRSTWSVYYSTTSGKCVTFDFPFDSTVQASGATDLDDFRERFTPFSSIEECLAVCKEPQPCDADNPCPLYEYPCTDGACETYPQLCIGGYCMLQCQPAGTVRDFGWGIDAVCPDGFTCTDDACVLMEP